MLADLEQIDLQLVRELSGEGSRCAELDLSSIQAPDVFLPEPSEELRPLYEKARKQGEDVLSRGGVAAMVVAGGQGTRLGFNAPKGTLPTSPVKGKTLFELFAESIRASCARYECRIPWYIMTSDATDTETKEYFRNNNYLGLSASDVTFFKQGVMPAVDEQGRILLCDRHRIALSPNGHGGSLTALRSEGILDDMERRGIEVISYFQVDNPLVSPADPLFIGLHAHTKSQISSIAVPKADDLEKVGNFVQVNGKLQVIEYSDLPNELAHAKNADGSRMIDAGNIAIHLVCPKFVAEITGKGHLKLPWHIANKKVPHIDLASGSTVDPKRPNARKFEMFIFDAIPLASRSILLEMPRSTCFSPVKNATGVDSLETAQRDMVQRAMQWLEECGVTCPRDVDGNPTATIEISPLRALDAAQLAKTISSTMRLEPGQTLYLE